MCLRSYNPINTNIEDTKQEKTEEGNIVMGDKNLKKSYGIACCRFNKATNMLEILLIKKRYTYSFVAFVFGQYNKKDEKRLKFLFNGMTLQEKHLTMQMVVVVNRRCRTGQVVDLVDLDIERKRHVMAQQLEVRVA